MATYKKIFLLILLLSQAVSCTVTRVSSRGINPPTKSFVKILHTTNIISCKDKSDPRCPIGSIEHTGSGMAVDIGDKRMTVLTAGHVCDTQPSEAIDQVYQIIYVLDHNNRKHQAWPVLISFDNKISDSDLCVLWVPTLTAKKIKFSRVAPKIGEEVYYVGSPLGIYHPPTVPILKGVYSGKISGSAAMATFPTISGASGSAVFNLNNEIVGVVFAANVAFHHVGIISGYESTMLFIMKVKKILKSSQ